MTGSNKTGGGYRGLKEIDKKLAKLWARAGFNLIIAADEPAIRQAAEGAFVEDVAVKRLKSIWQP
ncbi:MULTISPECIES: hypothetical protein [unclassified Mesorhizobium]|uniref:hypothetical protein n=1 Tax=unclassified Mesorhizobium TaxID=325217 RepID=UPI001093A608|nr:MULTISPECIES: hypothetical protein [unclassified Mesorhizobium]TGU40165.1 hypothetical protein EN799_07015 [bacterium M00.F.Ca.ET.156.01.1.1]TGQ77153.1 hypothetical protein EN850_29760 [Mesorhizobium sp. M8A.F.Ca.ET.207.01.1.1]TGQ89183.1 hypothetical protein EN851_23200 [Mesorhizobium sp. M8A.F.Ca.ET.208.01.1.1]TGR32286.1 hypothetical protein EN845_07015 [Mesorhizobium sp. M8A.F.Ca.ET.202.01.1.1]TGS38125.1 hypothetical protein EN825_30290 [Mesorhizobium sp. M8A.F.Ca.ET.182.01.1.1]